MRTRTNEITNSKVATAGLVRLELVGELEDEVRVVIVSRKGIARDEHDRPELPEPASEGEERAGGDRRAHRWHHDRSERLPRPTRRAFLCGLLLRRVELEEHRLHRPYDERERDDAQGEENGQLTEHQMDASRLNAFPIGVFGPVDRDEHHARDERRDREGQVTMADSSLEP